MKRILFVKVPKSLVASRFLQKEKELEHPIYKLDLSVLQ